MPRRLIALSILLSFFSLGTPPAVQRADAAFPGRIGLLAFSVSQTPSPAVAGNVVYIDYDLYTVAPGGAGITQITQGPGLELHPAWSPDGERLAFERELPPYLQADIFLIERDGSGETNLTNTPDEFEFSPTWSPDGRRIAFTRYVNPDRGVSEIDSFVMNADGSNVEQLTSGPGGELAPAWSPDGNLIAFRDAQTGFLGVIKADGSKRRLLREINAESPQWSPDGEYLTWFTGGDIWAIRRDGSNPRNLTARSRADNRYPAWSPDGRYIAFVSDRDGDYRVYRMNADGSHVIKLVDIELDANTATLDWGPRL